MTKSELIEKLTAIKGNPDVVGMELRKHDDNIPFLPIESIELLQACEDHDRIVTIQFSPNPRTMEFSERANNNI